MRNYALLSLVALVSSLSVGSITVASADEVVVVHSDVHPHHHYVARDGYYWEGKQAYRRVWVPEHHRYDYRPVHVQHHDVVVVHDRHDHP